MPRLSVNINKIATLRNARGGQQPNVLQVGHDVLKFGAHGLTVHPRPDGRHILHTDVVDLAQLVHHHNQSLGPQAEKFQVLTQPHDQGRGAGAQVKPPSPPIVDKSVDNSPNKTHPPSRLKACPPPSQTNSQINSQTNSQAESPSRVKTSNTLSSVEALSPVESPGSRHTSRSVEFNVEGYPAPAFLKLIQKMRPHQCTLVPDKPEVLTSNAGWQLQKAQPQLQPVLAQLKSWGVRSSLFIDPFCMNEHELQALKFLAPDRVELYTQAYAEQPDCIDTYARWADKISQLGIGINAGHDLNQKNLAFLLRSVPQIEEISIGHALICEALYEGLERTVKNYLQIIEKNGQTFVAPKSFGRLEKVQQSVQQNMRSSLQ